MVEAIERTHKEFALGLQFHPEAAYVKYMDKAQNMNDFMDTDGELNVRFAVELTPTGTKTTKAVKTGDQSDLLMWAAIGLVAGLLMLVLAFLSRKRDEKVQGKGGKA